MSDSQAEQIIHPAPDQVFISREHNVPISSNHSPSNGDGAAAAAAAAAAAVKKEEQIRRLKSNLRLVNNVCGPIQQYVDFQQCLMPEIRVALDINQWMMLILGGKAAIKSFIDESYIGIRDPPADLNESMESAYDSIDSVTDSMAKSMKEIVILLQKQSAPIAPVQNVLCMAPEPSVLKAMNSNGKTKRRLPK